MAKWHSVARVSIIFMLTFFFYTSYAQDNDSVVKPIMTQEHSPRKATILSAVLPGAGQIYNKKWWKVPIVYGAIGACLYMAINNNVQYVDHFAELVYRTNNNGNSNNPKFTLFSDAQLQEDIEFHQKWRDNFFIFTGVAYILNIVDANIDAHFYNFDVSPDLTLSVKPYNQLSFDNQFVSGVSLTLNFK